MVRCKHLLPDKVLSKIKGDAFFAVVEQIKPEIEFIDLSDCKDVTDVRRWLGEVDGRMQDAPPG